MRILCTTGKDGFEDIAITARRYDEAVSSKDMKSNCWVSFRRLRLPHFARKDA
ncbi:MAG: hypothetical protein ABJF04_11220 [Reichenbachiella sp.]|uniref:hypothetical protein n=1 Tax=Reichenbachiella sp. TaxID=2184521 RepID=UPI0032644CED